MGDKRRGNLGLREVGGSVGDSKAGSLWGFERSRLSDSVGGSADNLGFFEGCSFSCNVDGPRSCCGGRLRSRRSDECCDVEFPRGFEEGSFVRLALEAGWLSSKPELVEEPWPATS